MTSSKSGLRAITRQTRRTRRPEKEPFDLRRLIKSLQTSLRSRKWLDALKLAASREDRQSNLSDSVKCGSSTLYGKQCTAMVPASAIDMAFGDPEYRVARFCKKHEKSLLEHASGFYARKDGRDHWVKFDDYIKSDLRPETKAALRSLMVTPPSASDEPGYVYAFEILDDTSNLFHIKLGRATVVKKRIREWSRKCKSKETVPLGWWPEALHNRDRSKLIELNDPGRKGAWSHKLEQLVHIELSDRAVYQPHYPMDDAQSENEKRIRGALLQMGEPCDDCGAVHKEIFSFERPEGGKYVQKEWRKLVKPVMKRWGDFVETFM